MKNTIPATPISDDSPFVLAVFPPMTAAKYAELQGTTTKAINCQIDKGMLPVYRVGKSRYVNTYAIAKQCLEAAED